MVYFTALCIFSPSCANKTAYTRSEINEGLTPRLLAGEVLLEKSNTSICWKVL